MSDRKSAGTLELLEFTFRDDREREYPLRLVIVDHQVWFLATDVRRILKCHMVVMFTGHEFDDYIQIDRRYLGSGKSNLGDMRDEVWLITERKLYAASAGYREGTGDRFKAWVMQEVMPTVRHLEVRSICRTDLPVVRKTVKLTDTISAKRAPTAAVRRMARSPHVLYRFYDSAGRLLYVGITLNLPGRMQAHRSDQPWWYEVSDVRVEPYPSRRSVLAAESLAIRTERPLYNIAQNIA